MSRLFNPSDVVLFFGASSPLSQFYPVDFFDSVIREWFSSAEQCMMYMKARFFHDDAMMKRILRAGSPAEAKRLGRKVEGFVQDKWDDNKESCVYRVNMLKFTQNDQIRQYLLDTADKTLIEASPYDKIWGIGLSAKNPDIYDESKWCGKNLLGKCLMMVRYDIGRASECWETMNK